MITESIIYRKGDCSSDAPRIAEIFNYYVEHTEVIFSNSVHTPHSMEEKLRKMDIGLKYPFFVAEAEGRVVGYAYVHTWMPDPVYGRTLETTVYLDRDCRGKGVGSRLLQLLIDACRQTDAHVLVAMITGGNTPSERMALKLGFRKAGVIRESGFKFGRYWDDVLYELIL